MRFTHFKLTQDGQDVGSFPSRDLAVSEAARRAADTYRPVSVIAHAEDGDTLEIIFNPDGTNQNIWLIDKGKPLVPAFGKIYLNRGGGAFRCIGQMPPADALYYNQAGGSSDTAARFRNILSGWTFVAKGIIRYCDGTIEWDHSTDGHFADQNIPSSQKNTGPLYAAVIRSGAVRDVPFCSDAECAPESGSWQDAEFPELFLDFFQGPDALEEAARFGCTVPENIRRIPVPNAAATKR